MRLSSFTGETFLHANSTKTIYGGKPLPQKAVWFPAQDRVKLRFGQSGQSGSSLAISRSELDDIIEAVRAAAPNDRLLRQELLSLPRRSATGEGQLTFNWEDHLLPIMVRMAERLYLGQSSSRDARNAYHAGLDRLVDATLMPRVQQGDLNAIFAAGRYGSAALLRVLAGRTTKTREDSEILEIYNALSQFRNNTSGVRTLQEMQQAEEVIQALSGTFEKAALRVIQDNKADFYKRQNAWSFLQRYGTSKSIPVLVKLWDGKPEMFGQPMTFDEDKFQRVQAPLMETLLSMVERGVPGAAKSLGKQMGNTGQTLAQQFAEAVPGDMMPPMQADRMYDKNNRFYLGRQASRNIIRTALTGTLADLQQLGLPQDAQGLQRFEQKFSRLDSVKRIVELHSFLQALNIMVARQVSGAQGALDNYRNLLRTEVVERLLKGIRGGDDDNRLSAGLLFQRLLPALGAPDNREAREQLTALLKQYADRKPQYALFVMRAFSQLQLGDKT